jgi:hypothetical protein
LNMHITLIPKEIPNTHIGDSTKRHSINKHKLFSIHLSKVPNKSIKSEIHKQPSILYKDN